ncbi:MAG: serine carboxypeptidase [Ruminococcus sp.]|nr:serine carboxypeptidase [Ruminococcus sp.]
MNKPVVLCAGGDTRYIYTAKELCKLGKVYTYGIGGQPDEAIVLKSVDDMPQKADLLVLPMMSSDSLDIKLSSGRTVSCKELSNSLNKNSLVVGGRLGVSVVEYFSSLGHDVKDYFTREELVVRNCIPTAEGTLQIAMQELAITVSGSKTVITGYGRVAKACARLFDAVGSQVTVAARNISQLAQAQNDGCKVININALEENIKDYDTIINTVPSLVITLSVLQNVQKDSIVIDLASKPGGTDFEAAHQLNVKAVHALALPGKTAPITSGKLIAEAIKNIYTERRETDVFTRH